MNAQVSFYVNGFYLGSQSFGTIEQARLVAKAWNADPVRKALVSY